MKKILLFLLCIAQFGVAQQVNVLSLEKIKATDKGGYFYPKFSPTSNFVLFTQINYRGLVKYSFTNQSLTTINDEPGAGYDVQISEDGSNILYKKVDLIGNLKHTSLYVQPTSGSSKTMLAAPTRDNMTGKFVKSSPVYVKGKQLIKNSSIAKNSSPTIVTIEDQKMVLYKNGIRKY
ncbi:MAG: hypothetical protein QM751_02835 [Paludibacteraceae bacterium]